MFGKNELSLIIKYTIIAPPLNPAARFLRHIWLTNKYRQFEYQDFVKRYLISTKNYASFHTSVSGAGANQPEFIDAHV